MTADVVIATRRLLLRRLTFDDADFIALLLNQPSFLQYIGDKGVRTRADACRYLKDGPLDSYARHGFGLFLVVSRADDAPLGICGLLKRDTLEHVDVGFAFLPQYWAQGYARESAAAVLAYGRARHGLERIVAITTPDNAASMRVLKKLGFEPEGLVRLTPDASEVALFGSRAAAPAGLPALLAELEGMPDELERLLERVPLARLDFTPASWAGSPGESFSARGQVCHLRDIEQDGYHVRIRRLLEEQQPDLESLDGYALAAERRYERADLAGALAAFRRARQTTVASVHALGQAELERTGHVRGVRPAQPARPAALPAQPRPAAPGLPALAAGPHGLGVSVLARSS